MENKESTARVLWLDSSIGRSYIIFIVSAISSCNNFIDSMPWSNFWFGHLINSRFICWVSSEQITALLRICSRSYSTYFYHQCIRHFYFCTNRLFQQCHRFYVMITLLIWSFDQVMVQMLSVFWASNCQAENAEPDSGSLISILWHDSSTGVPDVSACHYNQVCWNQIRDSFFAIK